MSTIASLLQRSVLVALLLGGAKSTRVPNAADIERSSARSATQRMSHDDAAHYDAFVDAFTATFGGKPSPRGTTNVLPCRRIRSCNMYGRRWARCRHFVHADPISVRTERTGGWSPTWTKPCRCARVGASVCRQVQGSDRLRRDDQFPGGGKDAAYGISPPSYDAPKTQPDNRVYLSRYGGRVREISSRSRTASLIADDNKADAAEIGRPETIRRIRLVEFPARC